MASGGTGLLLDIFWVGLHKAIIISCRKEGEGPSLF